MKLGHLKYVGEKIGEKNSRLGVWWVGGRCVTTPILRECEDEDSHSRNGNLGVHQTSQNFRERLQGSKQLALKNSLYHWKTTKM
jgi:hypothetical protein